MTLRLNRLTVAWLVVLASVVGTTIVAATATPPPATEAARAAELKQNTLCPVCDGQNVLESNAPVAAAIRRQIDNLVGDGFTNSEIRTYLARQYGNGVNALPPSSGLGALVWVLPVVAISVAASGLVIALRRRQRRLPALVDVALPLADVAPLSVGSVARADVAPLSVGSVARAPKQVRLRAVSTLVLIAVGAIAIGFVVARSAGLARPGQTITGEIDRSARSLLFDAQNLFAQGNDTQARELVEEVFTITLNFPQARILSARLYEREGEVLSALTELDRVLEADPDDIDALTLRGWILVRVPDEQLQAVGIAALDAALAQTPDKFDPWVFRGYAARLIEGDLARAVELYEAALLRNPPSAMAAQLRSLIEEMRDQAALR